MSKKLNYCKGVIIAHGKSEYILAEYIKSNLHLPVGIYAKNKGKTSIQIDGLMRVLGNNIFKNKNCLKKEYQIEEKNRELINFFVMPIMDLDDTSKKKIQDYKSGKMFEKHWLSPYIIPIWNNKNLDEVLLKVGLIDKIPNYKEKGEMYRNIFPVNSGESDKEKIEKLKEKFEETDKTNMEICIQKCLDSIQEENK